MSMDPIAQALADLKQGSTAMNKQASMRVTADRYHGIQTPAPDAMSGPAPLSAASSDRLAALRGTPPPAYEGTRRTESTPALGVPQPAFTSKEMRSRTENWGTQSTYGTPNGRNAQSTSRPSTRDGNMRSRSPGPGMPRATSPQPMRARSPGPSMINGQQSIRARSPGPGMMQHAPPQAQYRAASPNPYGGRPRGQTQSRQNSAGMEMQLSSQDVQRYDQPGGSGRSRQGMMANSGRPSSAYGGDLYTSGGAGQRGGIDPQLRRERSKSMAAPPQRGMLHYGRLFQALKIFDINLLIKCANPARALYSYTAAIPEELSFTKGDTLAVLRLQDDGWWEAEISKGRQNIGMAGLVPSNYLQRC